MTIDYNSNEYIKFSIFATILAALSSELLSSLATHILIPLIDGDNDNDGKNDLEVNLKNRTTKVGSKVVYIGEFKYTLLKFILILLFLFLLRKIF